ncbi:SpvB/TcaC N-terminal domain-containing protein [Kitasatospora sp. NPDC001095]
MSESFFMPPSGLPVGGPDSLAERQIMLPSTGGGAFGLGLSLQEGAQGNGPFGLRWRLEQIRDVSRATPGRAPNFDDTDDLITPAGQLTPTGDEPRSASRVPFGTEDGPTYAVTTWATRSSTDRWEHWVREDKTSFWILYAPDGTLHVLGCTAAGRISDPTDATRVALWLIQESVSARGEHIVYRWAGEPGGAETNASAQRYLVRVDQMNRTPSVAPLMLSAAEPAADDFLAHLVFDYGQRASALDGTPPFEAVGAWVGRPDPVTDTGYGFAVTTRHLARQVIVFNRTKDMLDTSVRSGEVTAVAALQLAYESRPAGSELASATLVSWDSDGKAEMLPPVILAVS